VKLDSIGNGETMPAEGHVIVVCYSFVRAGVERGRQRERNFSFERVTGDIAHLVADCLEALTFSLADFDR